jgi:hypothetical protein
MDSQTFYIRGICGQIYCMDTAKGAAPPDVTFPAGRLAQKGG